jgi:hypothetical protein
MQAQTNRGQVSAHPNACMCTRAWTAAGDVAWVQATSGRSPWGDTAAGGDTAWVGRMWPAGSCIGCTWAACTGGGPRDR